MSISSEFVMDEDGCSSPSGSEASKSWPGFVAQRTHVTKTTDTHANSSTIFNEESEKKWQLIRFLKDKGIDSVEELHTHFANTERISQNLDIHVKLLQILKKDINKLRKINIERGSKIVSSHKHNDMLKEKNEKLEIMIASHRESISCCNTENINLQKKVSILESENKSLKREAKFKDQVLELKDEEIKDREDHIVFLKKHSDFLYEQYCTVKESSEKRENLKYDVDSCSLVDSSLVNKEEVDEKCSISTSSQTDPLWSNGQELWSSTGTMSNVDLLGSSEKDFQDSTDIVSQIDILFSSDTDPQSSSETMSHVDLLWSNGIVFEMNDKELHSHDVGYEFSENGQNKADSVMQEDTTPERVDLSGYNGYKCYNSYDGYSMHHDSGIVLYSGEHTTEKVQRSQSPHTNGFDFQQNVQSKEKCVQGVMKGFEILNEYREESQKQIHKMSKAPVGVSCPQSEKLMNESTEDSENCCSDEEKSYLEDRASLTNSDCLSFTQESFSNDFNFDYQSTVEDLVTSHSTSTEDTIPNEYEKFGEMWEDACLNISPVITRPGLKKEGDVTCGVFFQMKTKRRMQEEHRPRTDPPTAIESQACVQVLPAQSLQDSDTTSIESDDFEVFFKYSPRSSRRAREECRPRKDPPKYGRSQDTQRTHLHQEFRPRKDPSSQSQSPHGLHPWMGKHQNLPSASTWNPFVFDVH